MTTAEPTSLTGAYSLDPARTRLGFAARHVVGPKVRGTFETFDGRIHLDFAEPERSTAEVTIDAGSVTTGNTRRDKQLRSGDFFDAAVHPRITFRSTSVRRLDGDDYRLVGELTVKDTTTPVTLDLVHAGTVDDTRGTTRAEFTGRATLDRRDWGLTYGGVLISNRVMLELTVAVVRHA